MFEVLPGDNQYITGFHILEAYARTLENSVDGDMTKLSLLFDQEIRFWIFESSNILRWKMSNVQRL